MRQRFSQFELFVDGEEFFPALFRAIRKAKRSIYIETFIYSADRTGEEIAAMLIEKAKQGLDVRVLVDRVGMFYFSLNNIKKIKERVVLIEHMRANGVKCEYSGSLNPFRFQLDHRKLFIFDNKIAFTGGMNIGDVYREEWHDTMLMIAHRSVLRALTELFFAEWDKKRVRSHHLKEGADVYNILITQFPKNDIERDLKNKIKFAKRFIYIQVPYITDPVIIRRLIRARRRGVSVRVIVPETSNHLLTRLLHFLTLRILMYFQIEIYAFHKSMTHVKAFLVDDRYVSFGSANATFWSMKYNRELNIGTNDRHVVRMVREKIFDRDFMRVRKLKSYWHSAG